MLDNPARPKSGAVVARVSDLPSEGAIAIDFAKNVARFSLIIAVSGGEVRAYENVCPHAAYPLERPDGRVPMQDGRFLICSAHGASFEFTTGACVGGPSTGGRGLKPIELIRDGDQLLMA